VTLLFGRGGPLKEGLPSIISPRPDKLQKTSKSFKLDHESRERFLKVQKAWEILSNLSSRTVYNSELRALR
jgi:diphthamide biosynthesis protein 4